MSEGETEDIRNTTLSTTDSAKYYLAWATEHNLSLHAIPLSGDEGTSLTYWLSSNPI